MFPCAQVPNSDFAVLLEYMVGLQGIARQHTVEKAENLMGGENEDNQEDDNENKDEEEKDGTKLLYKQNHICTQSLTLIGILFPSFEIYR